MLNWSSVGSFRGWEILDHWIKQELIVVMNR